MSKTNKGILRTILRAGPKDPPVAKLRHSPELNESWSSETEGESSCCSLSLSEESPPEANPSRIAASNKHPEVPSDTLRSCLKRRKDQALQTIKTVRFDAERNKYYDNNRDLLSQEEWRNCWYTSAEIDLFRMDQESVVKRLFAVPQKLPLVRRRSRDSVLTYLPLRQHSQEQQPTRHWRETMAQAYQECRKVKKGDFDTLRGQVDRESLVQIYQQHPELVGLEVYVLYGLRGSVAVQVKRMLGYIEEAEKRASFLDAKLNEEMFIKASQAMTQPSRVLVHEIALAQATVLYNERLDDIELTNEQS